MADGTAFQRWHGRAAIGALAVVLVWLGWEIVRGTIAQTAAHGDPAVALFWNGHDADALFSLAEQNLGASDGAPDLDSVRDLARRALRADPINEGALRVLALAEDAAGAPDRAETLMALAVARSPRDLGAQTWLLDRRMSEGRPDDVLKRADAILRLRPAMLDALMPALTQIASSETGDRALIAALRSAPPWRADFLAKLAQSAPLLTNHTVVAGLQEGANPLAPQELAPYLNQLIEDGNVELSFLVWMRSLPPAEGGQIPYVFNGDFDLPVTDLPFDWVISNVPGATSEVVDSGNADRGLALHVAFSGGRVEYHHVRKLLVLPPGSYELSGLVRPDDLVNERGMVWRIYCAETPDQTLGQSPPARGDGDWTPFTADFEVPSSGCRAQWLRLELAARVPIEEQVSGTIWYDHLAVKRVDGLAAAAKPAGPT